MAAAKDQTYAVKISNPGFNAQTCADYQLAFNSSWPSLAIAFETTITFPYTGQNPNIDNNALPLPIPHNLGFPPFTQAWLTINGQYVYGFSLSSELLQSVVVYVNPDGFPIIYTSAVYVDETNVYPIFGFALDENSGETLDCFGNKIDGSLIATLNIKCYNLDLTKQQDFTFVQPANVKQPYDPQYVFKIAKNGKSADSPDLRNFIVHSQAQSPAILSVETEASGVADPNIPGNTLISYTNPAGYSAWFFGWYYTRMPNGNFAYGSVPIQPSGYNQLGASITDQNVFQLSVPGPGGTFLDIAPRGTLVVLRDPVFAPDNIFVTY